MDIEKQNFQFDLKGVILNLKTILQTSSPLISQRMADFMNHFSIALDQLVQDQNSFHDHKIFMLFQTFTYSVKNPQPSTMCCSQIGETSSKISFTCLDCMSTNLAIFCYDCFVNSNHVGHTYKQYKNTQSGLCDCGNDQMWNQQGFCHRHRKRHKHIEIESEVSDLFKRQITYLFQIYFYLHECSKIAEVDSLFRTRQAFGTRLYQHLGNIASQSIQIKILLHEILQSSINKYEKSRYFSSVTLVRWTKNKIKKSQQILNQNKSHLTDKKQQALLQKLFLNAEISKLPEIYNIKKLLCEIYSYQPTRISIIKLLFSLTYQNAFNYRHVLRLINYQYFSTQKLIIKLIRNGQMKPLQLNHELKLNSLCLNMDIFVMYFNNLYYISQNKLKRQYFMLHLQHVNVADMAFFRQYCKIDDAYDPKLDKTYLFTLIMMIKQLKSEKSILKKCIKQLYEYLSKIELLTFSLAQERAFAALIVLFCEGNLQNLKQPTFLAQQLELEIDKEVLNDMIFDFLKNKALIEYVHDKGRQQLQSKLSKNHTQKYLLRHLDAVYMKILINIYQSCKTTNINSQLKQILQQVVDQLEEQDKQSASFITTKMIAFLTQSLNTKYCISQIVISNIFSFASPQQIKMYYLQLLYLYNKKVSPQKFKSIALNLINNQGFLSQIVKKYAILNFQQLNIQISLQGRQIVQKMNTQALTYIFFYQFLQDANQNDSMIQSIVLTERSFNKDLQRKYQNNQNVVDLYRLLTDKFLQKFILNFRQTTQKELLTKDQKLQLSQSSLVLTQLYALYPEMNSTIQSSLYKYLISKHSKSEGQKSILISQIQIICKPIKDKEKQDKIEQQQQNKMLKRQKLNNKKKLKENLIKQKQAKMLKSMNNMGMLQKMKAQMEYCMYCREPLERDTCYLSHIGVSNFIEKNILKVEGCHMSISTCGHQVHKKCYYQYFKDKLNNQFRCFVCRKHTNFMIPKSQFKMNNHNNKSIDKQNMDLADLMFDRAQKALQAKYVQDLQFYNDNIWSKHNNSISYVMFRSMVMQIIINGVHSPQDYLRYNLPVHREIYKSLKLIHDNSSELIKRWGIQQFSFEQQNQQIQQKPINLQNNQIYHFKQIGRFIITKILQKLQGKAQFVCSKLSQHMKMKIQNILSYLTAQHLELQSINENQIQLAKQQQSLVISPKMIQQYIPLGISELHAHMGTCQFCKQITSELFICVLCGWKCCPNEDGQIYDHINYYHFEGSVFVDSKNGQYTILHGDDMITKCSIYKNEFLQNFNLIITNQERQNIQNFKRNEVILQKIYKLVVGRNMYSQFSVEEQ